MKILIPIVLSLTLFATGCASSSEASSVASSSSAQEQSSQASASSSQEQSSQADESSSQEASSEEAQSQEQATDGEALQVEITEENYQTLYAIASEYNLQHTVRAFIKSHPNQFEEQSFVDVYMPFESADTFEYLEDGYALQSQAHGMQVYQTMAAAQNAKEAVDSKYEQLKLDTTGLLLQADYSEETVYDEELDIAYKRIFSVNPQTNEVVISFLYADVKQEGYYLLANISYLTNQTQVDELYPTVLEEISFVFGIGLPQM